MQLILISGQSGSGKSIALNVLEDNGYFCIDNLPVELISSVSRFLQHSHHPRCALSVDVRSGASLVNLPEHITEIRRAGVDVRLVFLEASTTTLVKRFSETRRPHPLARDQRTVTECIELEREMLQSVREMGQRLDTSELRANTLRQWIKDLVTLNGQGLTLILQSFGFKHGVPLDADFVFDVRCLINPYYDPLLRPFNGKDACIAEFLAADSTVTLMQADIEGFLSRWLGHFVRDNRPSLTVGIGCTGGQHRSVFLVEQLSRTFRHHYPVLVRHRELGA